MTLYNKSNNKYNDSFKYNIKKDSEEEINFCNSSMLDEPKIKKNINYNDDSDSF